MFTVYSFKKSKVLFTGTHAECLAFIAKRKLIVRLVRERLCEFITE